MGKRQNVVLQLPSALLKSESIAITMHIISVKRIIRGVNYVKQVK